MSKTLSLNEKDLLYKKEFSFFNYRIFSKKPDTINIFNLKQIHSKKVIDFNPLSLEQGSIEADGLIIPFDADFSHIKHFAIYTADCLPIVVIGELGVAFLHAGWRGIQSGIARDDHIHALKPYHAFVGPHISRDAFEVSNEFKAYFPKSKNFKSSHGKLKFDLYSELKDQLLITYPEIKIEQANICTYQNEKFHSYRRNKTDHRNWNIISII